MITVTITIERERVFAVRNPEPPEIKATEVIVLDNASIDVARGPSGETRIMVDGQERGV